MTPSERDCLDFIIDYRLKSAGVSPSYREIAEALSYASVSSVARLIKNLTEKGALKQQKNQHWRAFVPVDVQAKRRAARLIAAAARTAQRLGREQAVRKSDLKELASAWQAWKPQARRWQRKWGEGSSAPSASVTGKGKEVGDATLHG